jgi:hypothetical protein
VHSSLPETLGEAIELGLAKENGGVKSPRIENAFSSPVELARQRWDGLVSERDMLLDSKSHYLETTSPSADLSRHIKDLDLRIRAVNERLLNLKPQVFGDGS